MASSFVLSLIVGVFVGGAAAFLGSLMISRRMALVGDAMGHLTLPGIGVALLLNADPSLGALGTLLIGMLLIWSLGETVLLSLETIVGIVFVSSLALGFLLVPEEGLLESLVGDISRVSLGSAAVSVLASLVIFFGVSRIFGGMVLLNLSPELAAVEGVRSRKYNLIYLSAVALIVAVGIRVTGSLLVGALVIVPPATARILTGHLSQYARTSVLIGAASSVAGVLISQLTHLPSGPCIILASLFFFLLALGWKALT